MKTIITISPILIACVALSVLSGCKARQVKIKHIDSTSVSSVANESTSATTTTDTGKVYVQKTESKSDTGTVEVVITPIPGKTINIKNGEFTGEATSVTIKQKKAVNSSGTSQSFRLNGNSSTTFLGSSTVKKDSVHVKAKMKDVVSKPSYGWIMYVVIGLIIIGGLVWLYLKFKPKLL